MRRLIGRGRAAVVVRAADVLGKAASYPYLGVEAKQSIFLGYRHDTVYMFLASCILDA